MKNNLIEAIVFLILGAVITATAVLQSAGLPIVVLGGLLVVVAIIYLVIELAGKNKAKKENNIKTTEH